MEFPGYTKILNKNQLPLSINGSSKLISLIKNDIDEIVIAKCV